MSIFKFISLRKENLWSRDLQSINYPVYGLKANSHRIRFDAYACVARQKRMRKRNLRQRYPYFGVNWAKSHAFDVRARVRRRRSGMRQKFNIVELFTHVLA